MPQPSTSNLPAAAGRFLGTAAGFIFAAIGLTVIGFLWFGDDGLGSAPLFFKVFGSFIALMFVVIGGTIGVTSLTARIPTLATPPATQPSPLPLAGQFACPNCGAALTSRTEASPHGDIKCPFCGAWFNIHRQTA